MNKLLKPSKLDLDPNSTSSASEWKHWHRSLECYVEDVEASATEEERERLDKLKVLTNSVSHQISSYIEKCESYEGVVERLKEIFVKKPNQIFARHKLANQ